MGRDMNCQWDFWVKIGGLGNGKLGGLLRISLAEGKFEWPFKNLKKEKDIRFGIKTRINLIIINLNRSMTLVEKLNLMMNLFKLINEFLLTLTK